MQLLQAWPPVLTLQDHSPIDALKAWGPGISPPQAVVSLNSLDRLRLCECRRGDAIPKPSESPCPTL